MILLYTPLPTYIYCEYKYTHCTGVSPVYYTTQCIRKKRTFGQVVTETTPEFSLHKKLTQIAYC